MAGESQTDFNFFLFSVVIILFMPVIGLVGSGREWAIFPGFGVVLALYFAVSLLADGSLTYFSGGATQVMASASTVSTSPWQFLVIFAELLPVMSGLAAVWKGWKG